MSKKILSENEYLENTHTQKLSPCDPQARSVDAEKYRTKTCSVCPAEKDKSSYV